MDLLQNFFEKQETCKDTEPSKELLFDLPCRYEATKKYGTKLLKIQGKNSEIIHKLFCIRSFAIEYNFTYALSLVKSNIVEPTASFPSVYMHIKSLQGITADNAIKLEKYRLKFEIADDIPSYTDPFPRSTSKHIRSDSTISYAIIASKIISAKDTSQATKDILKKQIMLMMSRCNLINLSFKIQNRKEDLSILSDGLRKVAASVPDSSPPF